MKKQTSNTKKQSSNTKKEAHNTKKAPSSNRKTTSNAKKTPSNTKKATPNTKKQSPNTKKTPSSNRKTTPNTKRPPLPRGNNEAAITHVAQGYITHDDNGASEYRIDLLPTGLMEDTIEGITSLMDDFEDVAGNNLSAIQRRRKIGAGIRNYGFIEKVTDLAEANPQFAQFFRPVDLRNAVRNIDACRDIALLLQSFARLTSNTMLVYSNEAFGMALIYYNNVKEMSRRGDPKAMELFRTLQPFFRKPRRASAEPTEKELERDIHALIHGKKDGKIVIENVKPKLTGGKHKVVDEKFADSAQFKETIQGSQKE